MGLIWTELEAVTNLFKPYRVGELLFSGFELPLFNFDFSDLPKANVTAGLNGTIYEILQKLHAAGLTNVTADFLENNKIAFMVSH